MKPHHLALVLGTTLISGLVMIAHGSGVITGRWSVGIFALGVAVCWVGLELYKASSNWPQ